MKKVFLILLAPLLMSTQCETDSDPVFRTEYFVQNSSSIDLVLIAEAAGEILIESGSSQFIAVATDPDSFVMPSENTAFDEIRLYREGSGGDLLIAYGQKPIADDLWNLNTSSRYEAEFILVITNETLD